jgi:hypothetical protein
MDLERNYPKHIFDTRNAMKIGDKWELMYAEYAGPQNDSEFLYSKSNPQDDAWNHVDGICKISDPVIQSWFPSTEMIKVDTKAVKSLDGAANSPHQCSSLLQEIKSVRRCRVTGELADGWLYGDAHIIAFGLLFVSGRKFKTGFVNCHREDLVKFIESKCDVNEKGVVHVPPNELTKDDRSLVRWTKHYQVYYRIQNYQDLNAARDRTVLIPTKDILENVRSRIWWFNPPSKLIYDEEAAKEIMEDIKIHEEPTELSEIEKLMKTCRSLNVPTTSLEKQRESIFARRNKYPSVKKEDKELLLYLKDLKC